MLFLLNFKYLIQYNGISYPVLMSRICKTHQTYTEPIPIDIRLA